MPRAQRAAARPQKRRPEVEDRHLAALPRPLQRKVRALREELHQAGTRDALVRYRVGALAMKEAEDAAHGEGVLLSLAKAFGRLQQVTAEVAQRGLKDPFEAGAAATDYLRLFGLTAMAHAWARMAEIALGKGEDPFYKAKLAMLLRESGGDVTVAG